MSGTNSRIAYSCSGYMYAPESFRSYKVIIDPSGHGNHGYIPLGFSWEQEKDIGYACITEGKKAAADLAKRYDRQRASKAKSYITYGFRCVGRKKEFVYVRQLYCSATAPLAERLRIFKQLKHHLLSIGCKIESHTEAKLDGYGRPEEIKKVFAIADINKPLLIRLVTA